jgi:hypothetical protein
MPRAESGMASLFDVSLRPSKPTDQEISKPPLSTREILRRVHGSQKVILWHLPIEGGGQAGATFLTYHGINVDFLHCLSSPCRTRRYRSLQVVEHVRRRFDLGAMRLIITEASDFRSSC